MPAADLPATLPDLVSRLMRTDPARPLVTFYDDASGERVELSTTTWLNWVAKTCGLVQDDLGRERGETVLVDLPPHWLGTVWLGAAWLLGMRVTCDRAAVAEADLVVCGPEAVATYAEHADGRDVLALSLRPLGGRFTEELPAHVGDYAAEVLGQPDSFQPLEPPHPTDLAWADGTTQQQLLSGAGSADIAGTRLITDANPASDAGRDALVVPLATGGSLVLVRHPDPATWGSHASQERATATWRASGQPARS